MSENATFERQLNAECEKKPGLEGVIAAETALSHVDGEAGRLIVRGYDLDELCARFDFEGVTGLLLDSAPQETAQKETLQAALGPAALAQGRERAFTELGRLLPAAEGLPIIDGLRLCLAGLASDNLSPFDVVASAAVFVAALIRARNGEAPLAPNPRLGHAADYLRMMHGHDPEPAAARAMDVYLMTVADHGLNASTFAARVIASTQSDLVSAMTGALGALKGPLHGGAPGPVLDMLDAIGTAENIDPWLRAALAKGERLMGFGHRIYRVRDPRADALKAALTPLKDGANRIAFAQQVEKAALAALARHKPDRPLDTNVEYFTALLLEALGIPRDAFTPTFAVGRIAGWAAHYEEQQRTGRLIRPQSRYVGPCHTAQAH